MMNNPMITWCVIVAVLMCAFIGLSVKHYCTKHRSRNCGNKATPIIEFCRETDLFYIPGDDKVPGIANKEDESKDQ